MPITTLYTVGPLINVRISSLICNDHNLPLTAMDVKQSSGDRGPHNKRVNDILAELGTSINGLTEREATNRSTNYGKNELIVSRKDPKWKKFLRQFTDVLIVVLLIAALVTVILDPTGIDWIVITAIVIINAVIGYIQEEKAEEAIENLKKLAAPRAIVFRSGKKKEIPASALVPGDIIYVESGMSIPSDSRVIESRSLKVNESTLTGESMSVEKRSGVLKGKTVLADRKNMLYMSTTVEIGSGTAVVTSTGMSTEIGNIADMIQHVKRMETPLQKRLRKLGKKLGILVLMVCVLIFFLEIARSYDDLSIDHLVEFFEVAVSLAVAAIPEGLPAVVTIALAIGLKVMAGKNVIIRKLPVVETLGSATVICTDKTGTLTTGSMSADVLYLSRERIDIEGAGYQPQGSFMSGGETLDPESNSRTFDRIMLASCLCSDATMTYEHGERKVLGDTTEGALLVMAEKALLDPLKLRGEYPRVREMPFDAERKMMSTLHRIDGRSVSFTKGAPEKVLEICREEYLEDEKVPLTDRRKAEIQKLVDGMARRGYRTLAFGICETGRMEDDLTFMGIVGIRDKIRDEAKRSVLTARRAGIRTLMITGDHKLTATAIGKEIGLICKNNEAINCRDLDELDDLEFKEVLKNTTVYARASPKHKVRIVRSLRDQGEIVAMTGDGVNDAPALKIADIGVAMGITGTDVSKGAADIILTDDNFASIVDAVEEGRGIYDNIRKVIQFLLSCNMSEVMVMLVAILLGWPLPLIALQILWMNLVTDSFPALALVTEPKEKGLMRRKPRDPKERAITRDMVISIGVSTVIITIGTLLVFWYNLDCLGKELDQARTIALTTMVMFQMWTAVASRSTTHTMGQIGWLTNRKLIGAIGLAMGLMLLIIYVPFAQSLFHTTSMSIIEWAEILVISIFGLIAVDIWEAVNHRYFHYGAGR